MSIYSFPEQRYIWGAGCSRSIDMDMGVASDACVDTHACLTCGRQLAGGSLPHGQHSRQAANAISETYACTSQKGASDELA